MQSRAVHRPHGKRGTHDSGQRKRVESDVTGALKVLVLITSMSDASFNKSLFFFFYTLLSFIFFYFWELIKCLISSNQLFNLVVVFNLSKVECLDLLL
jgi:hypothetical protein